MLKKWILSGVLALAFMSTAVFSAGKIDLNSATVDELQSLSGVGPTTAAAIIEYREQKGGFVSVEEIIQVKGIGEKKAAQIASQVTITQ